MTALAQLPDGYFVAALVGDGWSWGIGGEVWADGYATPEAAAAGALEHHRSTQPELCDRCGDQAACPDCVGA